MFRIRINPEESIYAEVDDERNLMMIRSTELCVNDYFRNRGYMYMSTIYELLGAKWNPEWENLCRIYKEGDSIKFKVHKGSKGHEVYID